MLLCQLVFDGYLTARPVTRYDPCCLLGPRLPLLAMPVEDLPFGLALVGLAAVLWEWGGLRANGGAGGRETTRTGEAA